MRLTNTLIVIFSLLVSGFDSPANAKTASTETDLKTSLSFVIQQKLAFEAAVKAAKTETIQPMAAAPAASAFDTLIEFKSWVELPVEVQEIYLAGLQLLMLDLEAEDEVLKTDYQTASLEPEILNWFLPTANAGDVTQRCVYAGWISEMDINNRYCMTPKSKGCVRGQVQCNPVLYGENKCAKAGRSATSICDRNKKSTAQIVKEIRAKGKNGQSRWSTLRAELKGYCADPRPKQRAVCSVVRARLVQLERVVGKNSTSAEARPVVPARTPIDIPQKISVGPADSAAGDPSDSSVVANAPAAATQASSQRVSARNASSVIVPVAARGTCTEASLLGNMKLVRGTSSQGLNFMSIDSAQSMMCTTDPIPKRWAATMRERLNARLRVLSANNAETNLARRNMKSLLQNFEACYQSAVQIRARGTSPVHSVRLSLISKRNDGADFLKLVRADGSVLTETGQWSELEGLLKIGSTSVCEVSVPAGAQAAETSGPIAVPAGSSGSIQ